MLSRAANNFPAKSIGQYYSVLVNVNSSNNQAENLNSHLNMYRESITELKLLSKKYV